LYHREVTINNLLIGSYTTEREKTTTKKKQHKSYSKIQPQTTPIKLVLKESSKPSNSGKASWKVRPTQNTAGDNSQHRYGNTNHPKG